MMLEPHYSDGPSAEEKGIGTTLPSLTYIMDVEDLLRDELYPPISSDPTSVCPLYSP